MAGLIDGRFVATVAKWQHRREEDSGRRGQTPETVRGFPKKKLQCSIQGSGDFRRSLYSQATSSTPPGDNLCDILEDVLWEKVWSLPRETRKTTVCGAPPDSYEFCQLTQMGKAPPSESQQKLEEEDSSLQESKQRLEEVGERSQWSGKFDFLVSMIAYAVGPGNVWRFPYLCYKNGGGSFLVAYAIFFALAAVPIFTMEVTIGQYMQRGAMEMWNMCPLWKGAGIGTMVITFICMAYICVIVAWSMFYMVSSFNDVFPWETCNNYWNNAQCVSGLENETTLHQMQSALAAVNQTTQTSVEQFWERRVLMQTDSISDFGGMQWELVGLLAIAWIIIYFALRNGITNARKFVYFCALFPYFLIAVLLIRGLTLPGAWTGVYYYLKPNMTRLADTTVWKDAGTQVFYSYGVGFGTLIALGSHNKFNHNCIKDAITMCFINGSTSILAGFAIFAILGYMSFVVDKDIDLIAKPGVGLAFLAYPEVAIKLPLKQLWSFLFFLMLFIVGLDSQVCMMEGFYTALEDAFPRILRKHRRISMALMCLMFFLLGLPMVTYAGAHWLTLVDAYGASGYALLFVVFFEVVGLAWGFGTDKICTGLKEMIGIKLPAAIPFIWRFVSPATSVVLFVFCIIYYHPVKYPTGEDYPLWANAFGWFLSSCSMIVIPGWAIYYLFLNKDNKDLTLSERFWKGLKAPDVIEHGHIDRGTPTGEEDVPFIKGTV